MLQMKSARICVPAIGEVEVPVFLCLCSSCNYASEVRGRKVFETRTEPCHAK
jgi:hypothetical protein